MGGDPEKSPFFRLTTAIAVMDDGLRERMRRAIGSQTWQEFLDAVYKLGLFRED